MGVHRVVMIGYANGDVHRMQVMEGQQAGLMATEEAKGIGELTNAGFRTIVASAWWSDDKQIASFTYAAIWNENAVEVLLHHGDRIANSPELYGRCQAEDLSAQELMRFCQRLKAG